MRIKAEKTSTTALARTVSTNSIRAEASIDMDTLPMTSLTPPAQSSSEYDFKYEKKCDDDSDEVDSSTASTDTASSMSQTDTRPWEQVKNKKPAPWIRAKRKEVQMREDFRQRLNGKTTSAPADADSESQDTQLADRPFKPLLRVWYFPSLSESLRLACQCRKTMPAVRPV